MSTEQGYSYTLTRTVNAPVAAVWAAWTTPEQYAQWAYAVPGTVELDVRPGGKWRATMTTPDGQQFPLTGCYLAVEEHRRLTIGMDVPGRSEPAAMYLELTVQDGQHTEVVLHQTCDTAEDRDMSEQGSTMLLDSLATFLTTAPTPTPAAAAVR